MTPMFCENEENGVVDIMAAKAEPKPSDLNPAAVMSAGDFGLVALPS